MKDKILNIENQLLVLEAQGGDFEALEKLALRWQKKLWTYVFNLTSNSQVTWDITQQCWLDIIKNLTKLYDPECFPGWIYRIATNKTKDWIKKKSNNRQVTLGSIELVRDEEKNNALAISGQ